MKINDFAREIGVSTATVSRAIHGRGRISKATRQMVLQRMEELGYTPNLHAQRLVTGRSQMIALHYVQESDILADVYFTELARGIQNALHANEYGLLLNLVQGIAAQEALLQRWVHSRAVDGVMLVVSGSAGEALLQSLLPHRMPCVIIGNQSVPDLPFVGSVTVDLQRGVREAARLFLACGHRRIGYLGSVQPDPALAAFREELERGGIRLGEEDVCLAGRAPEDGDRAMTQFLSRPVPPTAVFARTDALAIGALRAARRRGVSIPSDLSLIGHDDTPVAHWTDPPLTTVRLDCARMGRAASEILLALLTGSDGCIESQVVHTSLIERETVAAIA